MGSESAAQTTAGSGTLHLETQLCLHFHCTGRLCFLFGQNAVQTDRFQDTTAQIGESAANFAGQAQGTPIIASNLICPQPLMVYVSYCQVRVLYSLITGSGTPFNGSRDCDSQSLTNYAI